MKRLLIIILVCVSFATRVVSSEPDFALIKKAADEFSEKMAVLSKDLPSVKTASGAAKVINGWTSANDGFTDAYQKFIDDNRAYLKENARATPPPQLVAALAKLTRLNVDYPTLQPGIRDFLKNFGSDPEMIQAMAKFRNGLERLKTVFTSGADK